MVNVVYLCDQEQQNPSIVIHFEGNGLKKGILYYNHH